LKTLGKGDLNAGIDQVLDDHKFIHELRSNLRDSTKRLIGWVVVMAATLMLGVFTGNWYGSH